MSVGSSMNSADRHEQDAEIIVRAERSERAKEVRLFTTSNPEGYVAVQERTSNGTPVQMVAVEAGAIDDMIEALERQREKIQDDGGDRE